MDKKTLIPIGKMAKANNVSIATLRLYDEMGLIKPLYIQGYQLEVLRRKSDQQTWSHQVSEGNGYVHQRHSHVV